MDKGQQGNEKNLTKSSFDFLIEKANILSVSSTQYNGIKYNETLTKTVNEGSRT